MRYVTFMQRNDNNTYRRLALFQGDKNKNIVSELMQFKSIVAEKSTVEENVLDN